MKINLLLFFSLFVENIFSQTTLTLQPDAVLGNDAEVWDFDPNTNYGNGVYVRANAWTWSGSPGIQRSFLKYDLSAIPSGATITSAQISLYSIDSPSTEYNNPLSGSNAAYLSRVASNWNENTITWNNQPGVTTANQILLPQSTSGYEDYLNVDVTSLVADMTATPANNFGFRLALQTETNYRRLSFSSSDAANPGKHPKLKICYSSVGGINAYSPLQDQISIYPNPCSDMVNIDMTHATQLHNFSLIIFNSNGMIVKQLHRISIKQMNLDINELPAGLYCFQFIDEKNSVVKTLIKE